MVYPLDGVPNHNPKTNPSVHHNVRWGFTWSTYCSVLTNAFSFGNANILSRFHVPSTRKRWKRCIVFDENANFWKRSPQWKDLKTQKYRLRVDGSNSLKTQTFENDSVPVHLHSKSKDGEYRQRTYCCFYWYLAPWLWIGSWMFMLINLNNAFYTCVIEGWKRFQSLSSFPCGRVKRSCGCNTFTAFPVKWKRKLLKMHSCGRGLSHSLVFVYIWGRD